MVKLGILLLPPNLTFWEAIPEVFQLFWWDFREQRPYANLHRGHCKENLAVVVQHYGECPTNLAKGDPSLPYPLKKGGSEAI